MDYNKALKYFQFLVIRNGYNSLFILFIHILGIQKSDLSVFGMN
jgi:hypothetical protein